MIEDVPGKVTEYKVAKIRFNNGYGAVLCSGAGCDAIVKTGFGHADVASFCSDACKPPAAAPVAIPDDDEFWGAMYG